MASSRPWTWIDSTGRKCCLPPPGLRLDGPLSTPATSRCTGERPLKNPDVSRHIRDGVYFDRHRGKYMAYVWLRAYAERFIIDGYPTYSEALIARAEFLDDMQNLPALGHLGSAKKEARYRRIANQIATQANPSGPPSGGSPL